MRNAFADEVTALGAADPRVMVLSGDIGNRLFDKFKLHAPDRFLNCGIAEANMMGMAAGLALSGMRPIVYTITPFTTTRCFEQIRNDVCYHDASVIIVGTGSGLSYGSLGVTHLSCEDIAILRMLPGMTVICPADPIEVRAGLRAALDHTGPVYMRIGKKGEPNVHAAPPRFDLGKAITMREGSDLCLIGTGNMVAPLMKAANILQSDGIQARVENFHTVKPIDEDRLEEIFERYPLVGLAEEHSRIGGLAGVVAEWRQARGGSKARVVGFGVPDAFPHFVGSQEFFRERFGLTPENIAETMRSILLRG